MHAFQHVDVPVPNLHCVASAVAKSELTCFFPAPSLRFNADAQRPLALRLPPDDRFAIFVKFAIFV